MKSKYKLPDFILWIILGLIISVVIYILGYSPQEEFTIYKNECENKTLYDFEIRVYDRDCVEIQEVESRNEHFIFYKPQTSQLFCDNYEDYGIGYDFGMRVISQKYNYIKTEQVCNQIEVDEIETGNLKVNVEVNMNKNWIIAEGQANLKELCGDDLYKPAVNNSNCKIIKEIISKKDITKEWLEENCNCMDICVDLKCSNRNKCEYYKCFSDYEVLK